MRALMASSPSPRLFTLSAAAVDIPLSRPKYGKKTPGVPDFAAPQRFFSRGKKKSPAIYWFAIESSQSDVLNIILPI